MSAADVDTLARLLHGAALVADDLRVEGQPSADQRRRLVAWLGAEPYATGEVDPMVDSALVEVARECVAGLGRAAIERRYLVDVASGRFYREEFCRDGGESAVGRASVGPCPRLLTVGLGEVEVGVRPQRLTVLQYSVNAQPTADQHWVRVAAAATTSFSALADSYRQSLGRFPGLSEPFAIVAPTTIDQRGGLVLRDAQGAPLRVAVGGKRSFAAALERVIAGQRVQWIAGRLFDRDGVLMLLPLSVSLEGSGAPMFRRIS
jgi:hypothetical protein